MRSPIQFPKFWNDVRAASGLLLVLACAGCATWTDRADTDQISVPTKMNAVEAAEGRPTNKLRDVGNHPSAVIVDVEFLAIPVDRNLGSASGVSSSDSGESTSLTSYAEIWQWIDEAAIPIEQRRRLQANGIRIGKIVREDRVRERFQHVKLGTANVLEDFLSQANVASELSQGEREIPLRFGQRSEVLLHDPVHGTKVVMVRSGEETIGQTLLEPQFVLALTAISGRSPNAVTLKLRPEIQHGAMKQSFVSSNSAIRIDRRRESWLLDWLNLDLEMTQGESLLISATSPAIGLGKELLSGTSADQETFRSVVIIRLRRVPSLADRL